MSISFRAEYWVIIINGDGGCRLWQPVQADSQAKSSGLVLGRRPLGAILHSSNEPGKLAMALPWWQHHKHCLGIIIIINKHQWQQTHLNGIILWLPEWAGPDYWRNCWLIVTWWVGPWPSWLTVVLQRYDTCYPTEDRGHLTGFAYPSFPFLYCWLGHVTCKIVWKWPI